MKTETNILIAALLLLPLLVNVQASPRRDTVRGALVGAATGALISQRSSDISARTAIPVFAGVGALAGYAHHHYKNREYYGYYPYSWQYVYGIHPYYHPVGYRQRWSRQFRPVSPPVQVAPVVRAVRNNEKARGNAPDRHPGVSRIPVSFETPSGFPLTITITKVGNQYIGPRGESYDAMPTIEQLQKVYRP